MLWRHVADAARVRSCLLFERCVEELGGRRDPRSEILGRVTTLKQNQYSTPSALRVHTRFGPTVRDKAHGLLSAVGYGGGHHHRAPARGAVLGELGEPGLGT